jgi:NAD+ kinase
MRVLLIVNPQKAASQTLAGDSKKRLADSGHSARAFSYTDQNTPGSDFDIAFSLGGDGTVLFAARTVARYDIPILPLNLGTLGFIAAVSPGEWQDVFERWLAGEASISARSMLSVTVERAERTVFCADAMNDAVMSASGIAKTIRLDATVAGSRLASYRSDGLIAATPTGSTAYCASAGGPILDPEMDAIILNPICPFTLIHRPLVLPAGEVITVTVAKDQRSGVLLTIDGQVTEPLDGGDLVHLSQSNYKARLLASDRRAFYRALHEKLAWTPVDLP